MASGGAGSSDSPILLDIFDCEKDKKVFSILPETEENINVNNDSSSSSSNAVSNVRDFTNPSSQWHLER